MVLIYHNITPPEYFLGVHDQLVRQCYHGRRELLAYRSRVDLALGDSEFNRQELEAVGFPPTACCPSCPDFDHLDVAADPRMLDAFDDEWTNILFVGRVDPEQAAGQSDPVSSTRTRRSTTRSARLHPRGLVRRLRRRISRSCTRSSRGSACATSHILGQVTNEELTALYDVADLFLCASEHEGFCVPLDRVVLQARAGARLRGDGRAGDDGRRRRAVRHARSAARRRADARRSCPTRDLEDRDPRGAGRGARAAARAGLRRHARCGSSNDVLAEPAPAAGARRLRLLAAVQARGRARGDPRRRGPRRFARCRSRPTTTAPTSADVWGTAR